MFGVAIDGIRLAVNSLYPMPRPVTGCMASAIRAIASIRSSDFCARPRPRGFLEPVSKYSALMPHLAGIARRSLFRYRPSVNPLREFLAPVRRQRIGVFLFGTGLGSSAAGQILVVLAQDGSGRDPLPTV